jgi:hypothetical protein
MPDVTTVQRWLKREEMEFALNIHFLMPPPERAENPMEPALRSQEIEMV